MNLKFLNSRNVNHFFGSRIRRNRIIFDLLGVTSAVTALTLLVFSTIMETSVATTNMAMHNHVNLNVTFNGEPIIVPTSIGITQTGIFADPSLFADHSLDNYGMEGMSPLHTHDYSGVIHVESNILRTYTLGEFLNIWKGLNIDGKNVIASLDGKPVSEYRNIQLIDKAKIILDITS